MNSYLVGLLIPLGFFAMVSWIVYAVVTAIGRARQQRALSEFQSKLLERIGSIAELGAFLNTEAGMRFLQGLTSVNEATAAPYARILRAVQAGAVLSVLAIALYLYGWFTPTIGGDLTNLIYAVATILFGLGIGFLVSAMLSYWLSQQMGFSSPGRQRSHESTGHTL